MEFLLLPTVPVTASFIYSQMTTGLSHARELTELGVLGLIFCLVIAWQSKCAGFGPVRTIAWMLFVLMFGIAGFLTFQLIAPFPERVLCATCQKRQPAATRKCSHCGAVESSEGKQVSASRIQDNVSQKSVAQTA